MKAAISSSSVRLHDAQTPRNHRSSARPLACKCSALRQRRIPKGGSAVVCRKRARWRPLNWVHRRAPCTGHRGRLAADIKLGVAVDADMGVRAPRIRCACHALLAYDCYAYDMRNDLSE